MVTLRGHRDVGSSRRRTQLPAVVYLIVYVVLLLGVPSRLIFGPLGSAGTPANIWGLAGLLWWVCAVVGGLNPARGFTPVRIGIGVFTISVLLSYGAGMAQGWYAPPNVHGITDPDSASVLYPVTEITAKMVLAADRGLLSFGSWIGIALVAADGLRSWIDIERLIGWLLWMGAGVAALGIIQFFTGFDVAGLFKIPGLIANSDFGSTEARSILRRVTGTAIHPIEFAVVMAALLPLALDKALHGGRTIRTMVPVLLIGVALPMAVSRSGIVAGAVAFIVMFAKWPWSWRLRSLVALPFIAVVLRLLIPGLVGTIISLFTNFFGDPSITGRTGDYTVVFPVFAEHPILGRGLFTFVPQFYRILDNQLLMFLLELGVVGTVALAIMFGTAFASARVLGSREPYGRTTHLGYAISAGIAGLVVSYATFDAWGFPMAAGLSFLLIGLSGACWRVNREEGVIQRRRFLVPTGEGQTADDIPSRR